MAQHTYRIFIALVLIFTIGEAHSIKLKLPFQSKERAARGRSCTDTCVYPAKVCGQSSAAITNKNWCMSKKANCDHAKKKPMKNTKTKITYRIQDYYLGQKTDWDSFFRDVCAKQPYKPAPLPVAPGRFTAGLRLTVDMVEKVVLMAADAYKSDRAAGTKKLEQQGWKIVSFKGKSGFAKQHVAGFIGFKDDKVILAYHGTESLYDGLADANIAMVSAGKFGLSGKTHKGFGAAAMSSWQAVRALILTDLKARKLPVERVEYYVTGHSMGGSVATLGGALLSNDKALTSKSANSASNQVKVITVASPRVLNSNAAAAYAKKMGNKNVLRFWFYGDPVPSVPHGSVGFKHVGTSIRISSPKAFLKRLTAKMTLKNISDSTIGLHGVEGYARGVRRAFAAYKASPKTYEGPSTKLKNFAKGVFKGWGEKK